MDVHISVETQEQTQKRLYEVIKCTKLEIYESTFAYEEFKHENFILKINFDALALIRDGEKWSQLVKSSDSSKSLFKVFSFHFPDNIDNSGFVGWLSNLLKNKFGSGVIVICGMNKEHGGIFDYYGCPLQISDKVLKYVQLLVKGEA